MKSKQQFVIACPFRSPCDDYARILAKHGLLRAYFLGTQRGTKGIPGELTYLNSLFGYWMMGTRRVFSTYWAEWCRSASHPLYDRWVRSNLKKGDSIISSYGYANLSFKWVRANGGISILDAGNSHPGQFWEIVGEEHKKWNFRRPAMPPHWNRRGLAMLSQTDYYLAPSRYVALSLQARNIPDNKIFRTFYPVDISIFHLPDSPPPPPLHVIYSGSVSLRKGIQYLLPAMEDVRKIIPDARLTIVGSYDDGMEKMLNLKSYSYVTHFESCSLEQLAEIYRSGHIHAQLSLEEGLVRTALLAMSCGLYSVLTPNTGANDFVTEGKNGWIVPIRDSRATGIAIIKAWERYKIVGISRMPELANLLSSETLEELFLNNLRKLGVEV